MQRSQATAKKVKDTPSPTTKSTAKRKARRTQEERSHGTRGKLLAAASKLLVERGYGHVTVDDISSAAGMTNGARVYHFGTKLELMVALWEHLRERIDQAATLAVAEVNSSSKPLDTFLDCNFRLLKDPLSIAFYELMNAARVDPALGKIIRRIANRHRVKFESTWVELLSRQGYDATEATWIVRTTMCLLRGLVSDPFIGSSPERLREAVAFWRAKIG